MLSYSNIVFCQAEKPLMWNILLLITNNNSDFLCMIVSDMTFHNFYRIWLVSAYFAFETIVQIHVGSKCDSLFFCHIRKYKYKMYKKILSSIGKGPSETGWSDSYDKELCEFSVLLWFLICKRKHNIRLKNERTNTKWYF